MVADCILCVHSCDSADAIVLPAQLRGIGLGQNNSKMVWSLAMKIGGWVDIGKKPTKTKPHAISPRHFGERNANVPLHLMAREGRDKPKTSIFGDKTEFFTPKYCPITKSKQGGFAKHIKVDLLV